MYPIFDVSMIENLRKYVITKEDINYKFVKNSPICVDEDNNSDVKIDLDIKIDSDVKIESNMKSENIQNRAINSLVRRKRSDPEIYIPIQDDSLFWCIYLHKYGFSDFLLINSKFKNREIEEKSKAIEFLKSCSYLKSKKDKQEIMGDLMTSSKTSLFAIHGLCLFYNMHIFVVNKTNKTYIEYNSEFEEQDICLIYKNESLLVDSKNKFSVDLNSTKEKVSDIQSNYIKFESYKKALKGISTYKLSDLEKMALNIDMTLDKKMKKKEIYDKINARIS